MYTQGQVLNTTQANQINKQFVKSATTREWCGDDVYNDNAKVKRGNLVMINAAKYDETPVFKVVKVTSVKNAGSDYSVIRVADNEYSWRVSDSSFVRI
jgi:hypothetical protein